ncbi:MAG: hypothetical protein DRG63_00275 [Deltaproteobacteria bacterium]|nr:MAG: hypothetical protein DRG63_00275 [Deltaproteobacteria bacterium]
MELKVLIIGQIALDVLMFGLLIVIARLYLNRKAMAADFQSTMEKSIALVKEMETLGVKLERILDEKRRLTKKLILDLENKLQKAELIRDEIKRITDTSVGGGMRQEIAPKRMSATRKTIQHLLNKGLTKEEIARYMGLPSGELELIMKLDLPTNKNPQEPD